MTSGPTPRGRARPVISLRPRASALLAFTSLIGVAGFGWPLLLHSHSTANQAHSGDAPWLFVALLPLLLAVVLGEISEGSLDAKAVALLGILAACGAALRIPSPGVAGFEPVFFLLIPSGSRPRPRLRFRPRCADHRDLSAHHRRRRTVAALPDARRRLDGIRSRVSSPGQGET